MLGIFLLIIFYMYVNIWDMDIEVWISVFGLELVE